MLATGGAASARGARIARPRKQLDKEQSVLARMQLSLHFHYSLNGGLCPLRERLDGSKMGHRQMNERFNYLATVITRNRAA